LRMKKWLNLLTLMIIISHTFYKYLNKYIFI
jgi:hypothetical protein